MKTKDASNWFIAILSVGVILSILFVFKFRNASSKNLFHSPGQSSKMSSYTSKDYGFSFDFPADYYVDTDNSLMVSLTPSSPGKSQVDLDTRSPEQSPDLAYISNFADYAVQAAIQSSQAGGTQGESAYDKVVSQSAFVNAAGIHGIKFYFQRYTLDYRTKEIAHSVVGPVYFLDVSQQSQQHLRAIQIGGQESTINDKLEALNSVVSSLRFGK